MRVGLRVMTNDIEGLREAIQRNAPGLKLVVKDGGGSGIYILESDKDFSNWLEGAHSELAYLSNNCPNRVLSSGVPEMVQEVATDEQGHYRTMRVFSVDLALRLKTADEDNLKLRRFAKGFFRMISQGLNTTVDAFIGSEDRRYLWSIGDSLD